MFCPRKKGKTNANLQSFSCGVFIVQHQEVSWAKGRVLTEATWATVGMSDWTRGSLLLMKMLTQNDDFYNQIYILHLVGKEREHKTHVPKLPVQVSVAQRLWRSFVWILSSSKVTAWTPVNTGRITLFIPESQHLWALCDGVPMTWASTCILLFSRIFTCYWCLTAMHMPSLCQISD